MRGPRPPAQIAAGIALAALLTVAARAAPAIEVPDHRGWVNDLAGVIDAGAGRRITSVIKALNANTGAEIAVLTVDTTGGEPVFDYAMAVAEKWKPGVKGEDNGVVFLVSVRDREMYILVGYGLEGILPDGKIGAIEDEYVVPRFKDGDYGAGILAGVAALARAIDPERADVYGSIAGGGAGGYRYPGVRSRSPVSGLQQGYRIVFSLLFVIFIIYMAIRHPRLLLLMLIMGGGRGGFRGGMGGGFSGGFGGGGFGGGGAGRGW